MSDREPYQTPRDQTFTSVQKEFGLVEQEIISSSKNLSPKHLLQIAQENTLHPFLKKCVWTDGNTVIYLKNSVFLVNVVGVLPTIGELQFTHDQTEFEFTSYFPREAIEKVLPLISSPYIRHMVDKNQTETQLISKKELDIFTGKIAENQLVLYDIQGRTIFFQLDEMTDEVQLIGFRLGIKNVQTEGLRFCAAVEIHTNTGGLLCHCPGVHSLETLVRKGIEIMQRKHQSIKSVTLVIDPPGIQESMGPTSNLGAEYREKLASLLPSGMPIEFKNSTQHIVSISK